MGVSINGAPPKNIVAPFQTIKTVLPVVNFFRFSVYMGSKEWYHYAFFNNMTREESDKEFEKIAVPESRKVARETLLKSFANRNHYICGEKGWQEVADYVLHWLAQR